MKITKIKVANYRLLKDFSLELKNDLSLIVGKNNCGKTSLLSVLEKMINRNYNNSLAWEDINLDYRKEIFEKLKQGCITDEKFGIKLQIWIEYNEEDSYQNIQQFMMDLNSENYFIILEFSYVIKNSKIEDICNWIRKCPENYSQFESFIKRNMNEFFELEIRSLGFNPESKKLTGDCSDLLNMADVHKLLKIRGISANREVSNKENNHSLSKISNRFYKLNNGEKINDLANDILYQAIIRADDTLTEAYSGGSGKEGIFNSVFKRVKRFGGTDNGVELSIHSSLSEKDILSNNTTLFYKHGDSLLPEMYNGLGYLNLYGMIFEIETLMADIKNNPADINLVYIEEPESHTHPQLQYIFIKNIKELLKEHADELNEICRNMSGIQTLITTHSSHIVSDCNFDDLIYFKRDNGVVISKAFNSLKNQYEHDYQGYKFVKQYLTLNSSELFFADKVICIEGDTERILLPRMMQKVDMSNLDKKTMPLLSQNISIIETGAHTHVFRKLFEFLGLKVLIITDIDPAEKKNSKFTSCPAERATSTTNSTIKKFFDLNGDGIFSIVRNKNFKEKVDFKNNICIAYQTFESESEYNYQPASFEDAFICLNSEFIKKNKENLIAYKAMKKFNNCEIKNFYNFARTKIDKKSAFASSLLYLEDEENSWKIPKYIEEGLLWLREY